MSAINGVQVSVYQGTTLIQTSTTDSNGSAPFNLPFGSYNIVISKDGYVTTTYPVLLVQPTEEVIMNLPLKPMLVNALSPQELMSEIVSVTINNLATENMSEAGKVTLNTSSTEGLSEISSVMTSSLLSASMSETTSVAKLPTTWALNILTFPNDGSLTIGGTVSPYGTQTAGSGATIATTATTDQFTLYSYELADGSTVNSDSNSYELVNTTHNYTFAAQTLGTIHNLYVFFRAAWEAIVSASGPGSTSLSGTYEVNGGSTITVTATANSGHVFNYWTIDGELASTNTSFACPAQLIGTSHALTANFV
jgi:Carboxypeptidase regulatory-like domain/Divergent InlB B-repeat domain